MANMHKNAFAVCAHPVLQVQLLTIAMTSGPLMCTSNRPINMGQVSYLVHGLQHPTRPYACTRDIISSNNMSPIAKPNVPALASEASTIRLGAGSARLWSVFYVYITCRMYCLAGYDANKQLLARLLRPTLIEMSVWDGIGLSAFNVSLSLSLSLSMCLQNNF